MSCSVYQELCLKGVSTAGMIVSVERNINYKRDAGTWSSFLFCRINISWNTCFKSIKVLYYSDKQIWAHMHVTILLLAHMHVTMLLLACIHVTILLLAHMHVTLLIWLVWAHFCFRLTSFHWVYLSKEVFTRKCCTKFYF